MSKSNYKIKFNGNGADNPDEMEIQDGFVYGEEKILSENKFVRRGFDWMGWASTQKDADKGVIHYKNEIKHPMNKPKSGGVVELFAVWSQSFSGKKFIKCRRAADEINNDEHELRLRRGEVLTEILSEYKNSYLKKQKTCKRLKIAIILYTMATLGVFTLLAMYGAHIFIKNFDKINYKGLAAVVAAAVSFIGLVVGILKIITEYAFPSDDEKHLSEIVKAIAENDTRRAAIDTNVDSNSTFRKKIYEEL